MVLLSNSSFLGVPTFVQSLLLQSVGLLCVFLAVIHIAFASTPPSETAVLVQEVNDDVVSVPSEDGTPIAPVVTSSAFPDDTAWYNQLEGMFTWSLPDDVLAVAVDMASSSEHEPLTVLKPPVAEYLVGPIDLVEGTQYISVQFKNTIGWGAITNRKIQIDTIPPEEIVIDVKTDAKHSSFPHLIFNTTDETSGIDYYEMTVAGKDTVRLTQYESQFGYILHELEDGVYTVNVTAFDKAGNKNESVISVTVTANWSDPAESDEAMSFLALFIEEESGLIIVLLLLFILFNFSYIAREKNRHQKKEERLQKETLEIQEQMLKIFSALRDEIYDQINNITKKTRLSANEKKAVDGLNQALAVTQTLIGKEISDVKKILD